MYDSIYELTRKENKYMIMKENVTKMINVLSNSDVIDNLTMAQSGLKNYYIVNDSPCKYENIKKQKERISNCLVVLRIVLKSIDLKLDSIRAAIRAAIAAAEASENG